MKLGFEGCVLDLDTRELFRDGQVVPVSPKAFALLELLVSKRPKALSKAEIHGALWPDTFVSETNLANLVVELRAALGDDAHASRIVRTVPRFGYAFSAHAREESPESTEAGIAAGTEYRLIWGHRQIALVPGENLIGRDPSAAVWINDESVSRRHARILVDQDGARLEDLGSKNGTFLRGRALSGPARLEEGDEFNLGEVVAPLRFHTMSGATTTRTGTKRSPTPTSD